jgi:retinoid hydroxylase
MVVNSSVLHSLPLPPGSLGLPVIGETINFLANPNFSLDRHKRYGPVFKSRLLGFGAPSIFIQGSDGNQLIFGNESLFIKSQPMSTNAFFAEDSIARQTGNIHKNRRRLIAQAFQPRALKSYCGQIGNITDRYLKSWCNTESLDIYDALNRYTFDTACNLLVSWENAVETPLRRHYLQWSEALFSVPLKLPGTKYTKGLISYPAILKELDQVIDARQANAINEQDALGILLKGKDDSGEHLSRHEVREQLLTLLFAGHGTLTSALTSFILALDQNQSIKEKCRAEARQASFSNPIKFEELSQLPYLSNVLKEVLRLNPPIAGGFRKVVEDVEFKGYLLPKGWNISYQITMTHQDFNIYSDPNIFDPERFIDSREKQLHRDYAYIPYGAGIHECIGKEFANLEMLLFAMKILRNYDWSILADQPVKMNTIPFLHPEGGLPVKIIPAMR